MDIQQHSFAIYCILLITYVVVSVRDATEVYARDSRHSSSNIICANAILPKLVAYEKLNDCY